jgi:hypothetical protein
MLYTAAVLLFELHSKAVKMQARNERMAEELSAKMSRQRRESKEELHKKQEKVVKPDDIVNL